MEKKELLKQENIENKRNLDEQEILPIIKDMNNNLIKNFEIVDMSDRATFTTLSIISYKINKASLIGDYPVGVFVDFVDIEIDLYLDKHENEDLKTALKIFGKIKPKEDTEEKDIESFIIGITKVSNFIDKVNSGYKEIVSEIYEYFNKCKE